MIKGWEYFCSSCALFPQQSAFEKKRKECIMTVITPEKCSINGHHRQWNNLLMKGNSVIFAQLSCALLFVLVMQIVKLQQTSFDVHMWTSQSVIYPKPQRTQKPSVQRTLLVFSTNSTSVSTQSDNAASSDINIYILLLCSTRKQTVAWETSPGWCWFSSLSFCLCLYVCSLSFHLFLCFLLSYFYNSRYQETKNGAYSSSLVVTSLRDLRHAYSEFPFILLHSH